MTSVCEHKEHIGCALTALPRCCSCVDKRPLATAYPIYIDGKGMKLQGKRWQRYCWKCRDYWNFVSDNSSAHSLPRNPDPSDIPVHSEPSTLHTDNMSQTPHGVRSGQSNRRNRNRHSHRGHFHGHPDRAIPNQYAGTNNPHNHSVALPTVASQHDRHMEANQLYGWNANHRQPPDGNLPRLSNMTFQDQNAAAEIGPNSQGNVQVNIPQIVQNSLDHFGLTAATIQSTHPSLPMQVAPHWPADANINHPHGNNEINPQHQPAYPGYNQSAPAHRQARRPITNPFGTREELESEDYQSPLTAMFGRFERIREAREAQRAMHSRRQVSRSEDASSPLRSNLPPAGVPSYPQRTTEPPPVSQDNGLRSRRFWISDQIHDLLLNSTASRSSVAHGPTSMYLDDTEDEDDWAPNPIDEQKRGDILDLKEMDVSIACQICKEHKMDTLLEPCMHLAICHWCSELTRITAQRADRTWRCPICRGKIRGCRKVFLVTSEKHRQDGPDDPSESRGDEGSKQKDDAAMVL
ncbi:hypothetical protein PV08_01118 [Exophiala spinifera]|uniref:RING-type domain-containing protein n=1 Tax=Exophiala spinifera TaxID=91928 RepID=A0A0D2BNS7_9EURO|nr:uncharacterized protein PV08_01118 [Exophiala spinifera]KIW20543.1 hypothetical protein PV08_01118 [Exophiala spinifera]